MKKTKIVATIGPASESQEILKSLFNQGLNVCRLNFSHGNHEEHKVRIDNIKRAREEVGQAIGIMLDTKGPEIRLGVIEDGPIELKIDDRITLTTEDVLGNRDRVSVSYENLNRDLQVGNKVLIDDGLVELEVVDIKGKDIICQAKNYGSLESRKGVNIPNVKINLPALTEKDVEDIKFGIENGVDFIAPSFIRRAEDVLAIRKILEENNGGHIEIISKIENQEGVDNIDEILLASDGIMVARGDLGVEIETEKVPLVQKDLIRKANLVGKSVITATQMLDSMMRNPRPTRAEVADVANAILDGSGAIMLSGETAAGKYPLESVKTMYQIAITTESSKDYKRNMANMVSQYKADNSTTNAIGKATCTTATELSASAIITATSSGHTSKSISKFRPESLIVAATTEDYVMRRLSLVWGVYPVKSPYSGSTDDVIEYSIEAAKKGGFVKEGDLVVITAGIPVGLEGSTNLIKVHTIGKILLKGMGIGNRAISSRVAIGDSPEELEQSFKDGDILVCRSSDKSIIEYIKRSSGLITEEGGLTSHGAIVGLNLDKPTIVGAYGARKSLKNGELITLDSLTGLIYKGEARVL